MTSLHRGQNHKLYESKNINDRKVNYNKTPVKEKRPMCFTCLEGIANLDYKISWISTQCADNIRNIGKCDINENGSEF